MKVAAMPVLKTKDMSTYKEIENAINVLKENISMLVVAILANKTSSIINPLVILVKKACITITVDAIDVSKDYSIMTESATSVSNIKDTSMIASVTNVKK